MNSAQPMKDVCGPCLSPKEIKKQKEQELKDLKITINYLANNFGFEKDAAFVIGGLFVKLVRLQGPLK